MLEDSSPTTTIVRTESTKEVVQEKPKKETKKKQQIIFTPKILSDFGMEFCRQIILLMNPVIFRRYLNQLNNQARKKRL